jgi:hypothetical protein
VRNSAIEAYVVVFSFWTVWNVYARIDKAIAKAHIKEWSALTPPFTVLAEEQTPVTTSPAAVTVTYQSADLDTPDELALRSLLLGISYRTAGDFASSRKCLKAAYAQHNSLRVSTWIPGLAMFEMAVLDLKVVEARESRASVGTGTGVGVGARGVENENESENEKSAADVEREAGDEEKHLGWEHTGRDEWERALVTASEKMDIAMSLATSAVDMSSRLESRITMLRDEITTKREMLGIA